MNRKQRREMMRKMQSEDLSLEVIHQWLMKRVLSSALFGRVQVPLALE